MLGRDVAPGTTDPELIRSFFHIWEDPHPHRHPHDEDPDQERLDALEDAIVNRPEEAWAMILDLVDQAPNDKMLEMIGLSPLTNLIEEHGERLVMTIVDAARRNPPVRQALECVWDFCLDRPGVRGPVEALIGPRPHTGDLTPESKTRKKKSPSKTPKAEPRKRDYRSR